MTFRIRAQFELHSEGSCKGPGIYQATVSGETVAEQKWPKTSTLLLELESAATQLGPRRTMVTLVPLYKPPSSRATWGDCGRVKM